MLTFSFKNAIFDACLFINNETGGLGSCPVKAPIPSIKRNAVNISTNLFILQVDVLNVIVGGWSGELIIPVYSIVLYVD